MYPNPLFWETAEGGGWLWPHPVDATAQFDAGAGKMGAELAEEQSTSPPTIMALRKIRLHDLDNSNSEFLLFIQGTRTIFTVSGDFDEKAKACAVCCQGLPVHGSRELAKCLKLLLFFIYIYL